MRLNFNVIFSMLFLFVFAHAQEQDLYLTVQNVFSHLKDGIKSFLLCHPTNNNPEDFQFIREQDTGQGLNLTNDSFVTISKDIPNTLVLVLGFDSDRFGAYTCEDTVTRVTSLKTVDPTYAELTAQEPYITSNVGDTVTFNISKTDDYMPLLWSHNGIEKPEWINLTNVVIPQVTTSDAGIYETYFEGQRDMGEHVLIQLIVRSCQAEFWGDNCEFECPVCYNGGICHDKLGQCVCPPGFHGENCEIPCKGNQFGKECQKRCGVDDDDDPLGACGGYLFCLPAPYGCSCGSGFTGATCVDDCEPGYFGAGCTQECHCKQDKCDRITGECSDGCLPGWGGLTCQMKVNITFECPPKTFGEPLCDKQCHCINDEECDPVTGKCPTTCEDRWDGESCSDCLPGLFGPNCGQECHCLSPCNQTNGFCDDECSPGYIGDNCQRECPIGRYGSNCSFICSCANGGRCEPVNGTCECVGQWLGIMCNESKPVIASILPREVNIGVEVNVTCVIEGAPIDFAQIRSLQLPGLTTEINSNKNSTFASVSILESVAKNINLNCSARNEHGSVEQEIAFYILEPPSLASKPKILHETSDWVEFSWKSWTYGNDDGGNQGDVVECAGFFREDQTDWTKVTDWTSDSHNAKVTNLSPDSLYKIAVKCRRPGVGGEGPFSPEAVVRTPCKFPDDSTILPKDLMEEDVTASNIIVKWKIPTHEDVGCTLQSFVLSYWSLDNKNDSEEVDLEPTEDEYLISNLKANTDYAIEVSVVIANQIGGTPAMINVTTSQSAIGPVVNLQANGTSKSTKITWLPPINADPNEHISYTLILKTIRILHCPRLKFIENELEFKTNRTALIVSKMNPNTEFDITVESVTSSGFGESTKITLITDEDVPSDSPTSLLVIQSSKWIFKWKEIPCVYLNGKFTYYEYAVTKNDSNNLDPVDFFIQPTITQDTQVEFDEFDDSHDYNFLVRGYNAKGHGPWANYTIKAILYNDTSTMDETNETNETIVEDFEMYNPPIDIQLLNASATKLEFSWQEPEMSNKSVLQYRIQYNLIKSDENAKFEQSSGVFYYNNTDEGLSYKLQSLIPSATYEVQITAIYPKGESIPAVVYLETTPDMTNELEIVLELPPPPVLGINNKNETYITIYPSPDDNDLKGYQIIVEEESNNEIIVDEKLQGFMSASGDNLRYYIAAEIDAEDVPEEGYNFTVGDNLDYGVYHNVKLRPTSQYRIYVRAIGKNDRTYSPLRQSIDDSVNVEPQTSDEKCIIMGLKCLWFLILLICITFLCLGLILAVVIISHKRAKMGSHEIKQSDEYLEQSSTRKRSWGGSTRSYSVSFRRTSNSKRDSKRESTRS